METHCPEETGTGPYGGGRVIRTLEATFKMFADKAEGTEMSINGMQRWFSDAGILTKDECSARHLDLVFTASKRRDKLSMNIHEIDHLLQKMADSYASDNHCNVTCAVKSMKEKLTHANKVPHHVIKPSVTGNVDHMAYPYSPDHADSPGPRGPGSRERSGSMGEHSAAGLSDDGHARRGSSKRGSTMLEDGKGHERKKTLGALLEEDGSDLSFVTKEWTMKHQPGVGQDKPNTSRHH